MDRLVGDQSSTGLPSRSSTAIGRCRATASQSIFPMNFNGLCPPYFDPEAPFLLASIVRIRYPVGWLANERPGCDLGWVHDPEAMGPGFSQGRARAEMVAEGTP